MWPRQKSLYFGGDSAWFFCVSWLLCGLNIRDSSVLKDRAAVLSSLYSSGGRTILGRRGKRLMSSIATTALIFLEMSVSIRWRGSGHAIVRSWVRLPVVSPSSGYWDGWLTACLHADKPSRYRFHKLNGSSSPVLTATSLSYGESKNSTPTESKPLTRLR